MQDSKVISLDDARWAAKLVRGVDELVDLPQDLLYCDPARDPLGLMRYWVRLGLGQAVADALLYASDCISDLSIMLVDISWSIEAAHKKW